MITIMLGLSIVGDPYIFNLSIRYIKYINFISIIVIYMQVEQNNQNHNQQQQNNSRKRVIYLIFLILFLSFSTKVTKNNSRTYQNLYRKIHNHQNITLQEMLELYVFQQTYQGHWKISRSAQSQLLQSQEGKYLINFYRQYHTPNFGLHFQVFDGYYIDKGVINFIIPVNKQSFNGNFDNDTLSYIYNKSESINGSYQRKNKFESYEIQQIVFDNITITFSIEQNVLKNGIQFNISEGQNVTSKLYLLQTGKQNTTLKTVIFSAVLMVVSILPFSALLAIIRNIYQLRDNPRGYSFLTICFTCMWDCTLCIVSFSLAFGQQQALMLFIVQAFLFSLMFSNLQPRFMILIFQHLHNNNIGQMVCKFNLFHYGTLLLIYPILFLTNMNWVFYIAISCIFIPQIYTNGINGIRPNLLSGYYLKYLLSRYLLIFYLKCFPYNIFYYEPDYALIAICTLLISIQFFLLYIQQKFGAKKIIPSFLLEPVFNYKFEDDIQTNNQDPAPESNNQCAICLMSYNSVPPSNQGQLEFKPDFKLMKTPCNHVYHSNCLMVWMKVKMQCPQCRQKLPPFE